MKRIVVLGAGESGAGAAVLAKKQGFDVFVSDTSKVKDQYKKLLDDHGIAWEEGHHTEEKVLSADEVIKSPGIPDSVPMIQRLIQQGTPIISEIEFAGRYTHSKMVCITGSNGKTTTTSLIYHIFKDAGYDVGLAGNIGRSLALQVAEDPHEYYVIELSSFQLHSMKCAPDVAVITNLSPNHLDKHRDFQDYIDAKRAIFENQRPDARLILNQDDGHTEYYAGFSKAHISYFSDKHPVEDGAAALDGVIYRIHDGVSRAVMKVSDIRLPGEHNVLNYLAAFSAVEGLVNDEVCAAVARSFGGVEHRLEHVRVLRGITFINDSIGTSPTRTSAGLHAMKRKPIVIAGGYDKHIPFDGLGDELCLLSKKVFLTGDTAGKIYSAIRASRYYEGSGLEVRIIDDFKQAVKAAAEVARAGDIVLFSPACAAFDRFKNFAERGKYFKSIVMELK